MDEIKQAMAKAFFASAWADQCEEAGESARLSGREIMDEMPATIDGGALKAAEALAADMTRMNGASLDVIYERARAIANGDREPSREMFGHYCAMQAMGHGVGLSDAFGSAVREAVKVPYHEFSAFDLERDYFEESQA